jgi:molybdate transport system substrate-binding protein
MKYWFLFLSFFLSQQLYAEEIRIAVAADLKYAMEELVKDFSQSHQSDKIEIITGSSGKFFHQISNGAPFDVFFSADIEYPQKLFQEKQAITEPKLYAIGRLILWRETKNDLPLDLNFLKSPALKKIAIANPLHAPYGKRAKELLEKLNLWEELQSKLVFTENVAQVFQYVHSGAVELGIGAFSLALSPAIKSSGQSFLIESNLHTPLEQGYVILKRAENKQLAFKFAHYLETPSARVIFQKYGFKLPNE